MRVEPTSRQRISHRKHLAQRASSGCTMWIWVEERADVHVPISVPSQTYLFLSLCSLCHFGSCWVWSMSVPPQWNSSFAHIRLLLPPPHTPFSLIFFFFFQKKRRKLMFCCLTEFWRVCAILYKVMYLTYYFIFLWIKCEQIIARFSFLLWFIHRRVTANSTLKLKTFPRNIDSTSCVFWRFYPNQKEKGLKMSVCFNLRGKTLTQHRVRTGSHVEKMSCVIMSSHNFEVGSLLWRQKWVFAEMYQFFGCETWFWADVFFFPADAGQRSCA